MHHENAKNSKSLARIHHSVPRQQFVHRDHNQREAAHNRTQHFPTCCALHKIPQASAASVHKTLGHQICRKQRGSKDQKTPARAEVKALQNKASLALPQLHHLTGDLAPMHSTPMPRIRALYAVVARHKIRILRNSNFGFVLQQTAHSVFYVRLI